VRLQRPLSIVALASFALAAGAVGAADWQFQPHVMIGETLTDNVTLAPSGQEKRDLVQQLSPGLRIDGKAARLNAELDYTMQNLFYTENSEFNRTNHLVDAKAKAEFVQDLVFLDARANARRESISQLGPSNPENLNAVGNQADIRTYLLSPYLAHRFAEYGRGELRYTYTRIDSNAQDGLFDSQTNRFAGEFKSGMAYRDVLYGANFSKARTDYRVQGTPSTDVERETVNGGYRVLSHVFLIGTLGHESNSYAAVGPTSGSIWEVGARWEPSKLTTVEVTTGHRYFGTTYGLRIDHRSRLMYWNAGLSEDIATSSSAYGAPASQATISFFDALLKTQIEDDTIRAAYVRDLLQRNRYLATQFGSTIVLSNLTYLEKHFEASWGLNTGKSTAMINVYDVVRTAQSSGIAATTSLGTNDFAISQNIRTIGIGGYVTTKLAPKLSANAGANYARFEFTDAGRTDTVATVSVGLAQQFTPKAYGTVDLRRAQRSSVVQAAEYHEDSLRAVLTFLF